MSKAASSKSAAPAAAASGAPTEATLTTALKNASEKPLQYRKDGMVALSQLLTGAWSNLASNVNGGKILTPILRDGNTFLNHFAAINDDNIALYLPFYPILFHHHFHFLSKSKLDEPHCPLYLTLVKLMLHPSYKIRQPIVAMVAKILNSPTAPSGLANILLRTLQLLAYSKVPFATPASPTPAAAANASSYTSFIWSRALLTIGGAASASPSNVPLALFVACDPVMKNEDARRPQNAANCNFEKLLTIWALKVTTPPASASASASVDATALSPKVPKQLPLAVRRGEVLKTLEAQFPEIEKLILSDRGLLQANGPLFSIASIPSPVAASAPPAVIAAAQAALVAQTAGLGDLDAAERNARQRNTSISFLLALFRALPSLSVSKLLPSLYGLLSHPEFDKLTPESIAIYKGQDGTLVDFVAEGEFRAVAGENKNVKREKDWTEEDERLERMAQERARQAAAAAAAKKPVGKPGAKPAPGAKAPVLTGQAKIEAERKQKIDDQTALRGRMRVAKAQVEPVLSFLGLLAQRETGLVHSQLNVLLPKLYSLFNNELVRDAAVEAHRKVVACIDRHVGNIGSRLSLSVETLLLNGAKSFLMPNTKRLLSNTLVQLRIAAERKAFTPNTFLYVFPIMRHTILESGDPTDVPEEDEKEAAGDEEEQEFKTHASGPKKVANLEDDDEEEEEAEEEDADGDDEKEEKEEEKAEPAAAAASAPTDSSDAEKALGAGLQLSLSAASTILNIHCGVELHDDRADGLRFPVSGMFSALLHILARINTLYAPTLEAITNLASANVTSDEILPLLSVEGILSPLAGVRTNALQALAVVRCFSPSLGDARQQVPHFELFTQRIWIACHDVQSEVSTPAASVWEKYSLGITESYLDGLIELLTSKEVVIRTAVGTSIASAVQLYPASAHETLRKMMALFVKSPDEVLSSNFLGLRQGKEYVYRWHTRSGVAQAIGACTDSISSAEILSELFDFFVAHGLKDMHDQVWEDVLNATLKVINTHGKQHMDVLLPVLEGFLSKDMAKTAAASAAASSSSKGKKAPVAVVESEEEEAQNDRLREGVILSMGTLARHMDENNSSIVGVVDSLIESLRTPSHSVQKSVSECLAPLMAFPAIADDAGKWIDLLMLRLSTSDEYGERKGAAFGLAGVVKGLKLAALKKYSILDRLAVMVQDKTSVKARQGALFAYERLFFELGSRFEPYVAHILPFLLACYGDASVEVREATQDAAKMVMSHLTAHGIKLVLPLVLRALDEKAWRTKLESIGLLSAMAYCSPTQLSACLPMIVPRLLEVNADANEKVQVASRAALKQIGSVVRNPEILTLVPVLLAALNDPTMHTKRALQDLMRTSFVHSVDPPSLALIIPILRKGMKGRTAITKKMSAQVVGSMCSLIGDVKDILPYSSTLLKYLKQLLIDPNPEVRAVAARALAALYKGIINEEVEGYSDLREWLLETLRSDDTTPTIRSGCAQGLAQLLAVQGLEPTSQLLPTLFAETKSDRAVVREGFFNLFGFLPEAFQQVFSIFVADVLPVIIEGLADEIGLVREAALAAGQSLVLNFAQSKTDLLLPALEDGIVNSDWRIRLSSVQLLGVMLLRLAGVSIKMIVGANNHAEDESDEKSAATICTREQENHIESVLGTERRNRLISTVYLMRCDVVPGVADLAFRVWKSIVSNSPRMLTTILPVLMSLIISDLASTKEERQSAAGRTLGELCTRMGDYILAEIVPILQTRLSSDDKFTRQGVCLGLSEVMASSRKGDLAAYMADLVPSVRDALCDNEELVRKAAGVCFQTLLRTVGKRAVDDIIPALLWTLSEEEGDDFKSQLVLEGIKVVLSINSTDVLPYLIPALAKTPLSLYNAKSLAFLSGNFTKGFIRYVESVTNALIDGISHCDPNDLIDMRVACSQVVLCVSQDCVHSFVNVLEETSSSTRTASVKSAVALLIASFTSNTKTNFESHMPLLMQILLRLFVEEGELLETGVNAMATMMKTLPDEKLVKHITFVRTVIEDLRYDQYDHCRRVTVPGFNLKNGITSLVPMFQHGLMHGTASVRVESAEGLSDIINLTSEAALGPHVIKITGPLIRIVGDRFPAEVKSAILNTLYLLICKCAKQLKPFLPQLQTTFIKALSDPNATVRSRGGVALAELITEPKRATTVLAELAASVASDSNPALKTSMLQAMVGIVSNKLIGPQLTPDVIIKLTGLASDYLVFDKDSVRRESARLLAVTSPFMSEADLTALVSQKLLARTATSSEKDGSLVAIQAICKISGARLDAIGQAPILKFALAHLNDSQSFVVSAAILALGELMLHASRTGDNDTVVTIAKSLSPFVLHDVAQVRQDTASRFQLLGEQSVDSSVLVYEYIVPNLLSRSVDSNGPARLAIIGAMHTLFQFQGDFEKAEKLLGAYHAKATKKDASAATALVIFIKSKVAKAVITPIVDELWKNGQGESLADPSTAVSAPTDEE